jgi:hypothetical protein
MKHEDSQFLSEIILKYSIRMPGCEAVFDYMHLQTYQYLTRRQGRLFPRCLQGGRIEGRVGAIPQWTLALTLTLTLRKPQGSWQIGQHMCYVRSEQGQPACEL